MLTEGYLRGWLTFEDKTRYSPLREEYILSVLERLIFADLSAGKLQLLGSLMSGKLTQDGISSLTQDMQKQVELTLPYMSEKTRIRNQQPGMDVNDPSFWRKLLAEENRKLKPATKPNV